MEEKEEKKEKEPTADAVMFNIGQDQLNLISGLLGKADTNRMEGDTAAWFDSLTGIRLLIISKLGETIRAELEKTERVIRYILGKFYADDVNDTEGIKTKHNNKLNYILNAKLRKYQTRLMELMDERDYLIPSKQSRTNLFGNDDPDEKVK